MSKHIEIKHKLQLVGSKFKFEEILEDSMLSETEKQFMKMFYVEQKDIQYIADTLGYSKNGISKMHRRILNKIEKLL